MPGYFTLTGNPFVDAGVFVLSTQKNCIAKFCFVRKKVVHKISVAH